MISIIHYFFELIVDRNSHGCLHFENKWMIKTGFFFVLHTKPVFPQYKRERTFILVSLIIFSVSFVPIEHPSLKQVHDCFSPFFPSWVCILPRVFRPLQLQSVRGKPLTNCSSSLFWLWYLDKFFRSCLVNFYSCQSVKKAELDMFCFNWVCCYLLTHSLKPQHLSVQEISTLR